VAGRNLPDAPASHTLAVMLARSWGVVVLARTVAVLALVLCPRLVVAQSSDARALRGLRSVEVTVSVRSSPETDAVALDTASVRTQVELELRGAGVLVSPSALAKLFVSVTFLTGSEDLVLPHAYKLELYEWVAVRHRPTAGRVWAVTWQLGGVGVTTRSLATGHISESVRQMTERFLNDYLAANPPRR
jgi:hypothetical protein